MVNHFIYPSDALGISTRMAIAYNVIFVQLEILLGPRLNLSLRRRQDVCFGPLKKSDNFVRAFVSLFSFSH